MTSQFELAQTLYRFWRHPHATRDAILAFQSARLRRLVTHAAAYVPYYRRLFERHGLTPGDIRTTADLPAIPITSKRDLVTLPPEDVVARGLDPASLLTRRTSGSSGEPFTIHRTRLETRVLRVLRLRGLHHLGLRPTDRVATIASARPMHPGEHQLPDRVLAALGLYRQRLFDCIAPTDEILAWLQQYKPHVLTGLSNIILHVARAGGRGLVRPRFVVVGGEVATPSMRQEIADWFGAPVYESYGAHEGMTLATECRQTGLLHVVDDGAVVEVLRDGKPAVEGEAGEIVLTNLHAFAMPFLRYRLGDIVVRGPDRCPCGQPFSTISEVQGRMLDYFPLPSGRLLHPYVLSKALLENARWILAYRFVQHEVNRIVMYVVPDVPPDARHLDRLRRIAAGLLEPGVEFAVEVVSDLDLESGGKFRVSRSLVQSVYDG